MSLVSNGRARINVMWNSAHRLFSPRDLLCLQLARTQCAQKRVCCVADFMRYKHRVRLAAAFILAGVPSSECMLRIQSRCLAQT